MPQDVSEVAEKTVKKADLTEGADAAYQNLKSDLGATRAKMAPSDYAAYVGRVAEVLQENGTIPALSIQWAEDVLSATPSKEGLTRQDLNDRQRNATADKALVLDGAFARGIQTSFDFLKTQNIDRTLGSKVEKDIITSADLEMFKRKGAEQAEHVRWWKAKLYEADQTPEWLQHRAAP